MRDLTEQELKKVSGAKTDWDRYNANHGITGPINNHGYGNMPHPPSYDDLKRNMLDGAILGGVIGGPVGAIEGGIAGGTYYIVRNAYDNARDYYF